VHGGAAGEPLMQILPQTTGEPLLQVVPQTAGAHPSHDKVASVAETRQLATGASSGGATSALRHILAR
jgi:hypothetical protein